MHNASCIHAQVVVEDNTLYGFKGLFSRFAPIGVHFSLLLIIAGATVGGLCGAKGDVMIPEGQAFLLGPALTRAGPLAGKLLPQTVVNVNNFRIDYSDEGKIEQFYSDLSVLEGVLDNQVFRRDQSLLCHVPWTLPLQAASNSSRRRLERTRIRPVPHHSAALLSLLLPLWLSAF